MNKFVTYLIAALSSVSIAASPMTAFAAGGEAKSETVNFTNGSFVDTQDYTPELETPSYEIFSASNDSTKYVEATYTPSADGTISGFTMPEFTYDSKFEISPELTASAETYSVAASAYDYKTDQDYITLDTGSSIKVTSGTPVTFRISFAVSNKVTVSSLVASTPYHATATHNYTFSKGLSFTFTPDEAAVSPPSPGKGTKVPLSESADNVMQSATAVLDVITKNPILAFLFAASLVSVCIVALRQVFSVGRS